MLGSSRLDNVLLIITTALIVLPLFPILIVPAISMSFIMAVLSVIYFVVSCLVVFIEYQIVLVAPKAIRLTKKLLKLVWLQLEALFSDSVEIRLQLAQREFELKNCHLNYSKKLRLAHLANIELELTEIELRAENRSLKKNQSLKLAMEKRANEKIESLEKECDAKDQHFNFAMEQAVSSFNGRIEEAEKVISELKREKKEEAERHSRVSQMCADMIQSLEVAVVRRDSFYRTKIEAHVMVGMDQRKQNRLLMEKVHELSECQKKSSAEIDRKKETICRLITSMSSTKNALSVARRRCIDLSQELAVALSMEGDLIDETLEWRRRFLELQAEMSSTSSPSPSPSPSNPASEPTSSTSSWLSICSALKSLLASEDTL